MGQSINWSVDYESSYIWRMTGYTMTDRTGETVHIESNKVYLFFDHMELYRIEKDLGEAFTVKAAKKLILKDMYRGSYFILFWREGWSRFIEFLKLQG